MDLSFSMRRNDITSNDSYKGVGMLFEVYPVLQDHDQVCILCPINITLAISLFLVDHGNV